jgi:hypothetical protein
MKRNATSQHLMLKRMFEHLSAVEEWNDPIEAKQKKRKERKERKTKESKMARKKKDMEKKKKKAKGQWRGKRGKRRTRGKKDKLERALSLAPLYGYTPKYVTIDTDVLHGLLGGRTGTRMALQDFTSKQNSLWLKIFKIPAPLLVLGDES